MNTWTAGAKAELERYLAAIRRPLEQAGADAVEVIDDLKRHIEADIAAAQLRVVTVTDLRPMLARFGEPTIVSARTEVEIPVGANSLNAFTGLGVTDALAAEELKPRRVEPGEGPQNIERPGFGLLLFGTIYPALVILFEWMTGFCAKHFFNPIPTVSHFLLLASIPIVNAYVWRALRTRQQMEFPRLMGWLSSLAFGVSIIYSAVFFPLVLPALFALIFFGLGLLPLTPIITATSTGLLRKGLVKMVGRDAVLGAWPGILIAGLAFLLVDIRHIGSNVGMQIASGQEQNGKAVAWLRMFGDEKTMLRACRPKGNNLGSLAPLLYLVLPKEYHLSAEQAQRLYFQVYGRAYNSVAAPNEDKPWLGTVNLWRTRTFDSEQGGAKVGSPVPGLSMRTSRIDATTEPNAALSYLEWIFEFRNDSAGQAEARCEILLPPEGTVSRLTLWVNGEEREAAFAGKAEVRQAYENVVVQRRDPVLVTSSGRDSVLMQCFPVPPNGGMMKVRLGVTVPLQLDANKNGILAWPIVRERNFALSEKLEHSFWLDSPRPIESLGIPLTVERTQSGHFMAHGKLEAGNRSILQPALLIRRDGIADESWVKDTRANDGSSIVQKVRRAEAPQRKDIVLVIDGSAALGRAAQALRSVTVPQTFRVVAARDPVREFTVGNSNDWSRVLSEVHFVGGQDNLPALERGWELAATNGSGTLIWLHGAQPGVLSSSEGLKQRFERRRSAVELLDLQMEYGPNAILPLLPKTANWRFIPMYRPTDETLSKLLLELSGQTPRWKTVRERTDLPPVSAGAAESNLHLARAWASEEIQRTLAAGKREEAVEIAALYQLVSEVSGAVVLETAQQFQAAGLQPVNPSTVPVVPEPGTWALLLLGLVVFLCRRRIFEFRRGV